ncbi:DUF2141 domain-containing protein [Pseudoalteromonas luteoviolacea]|uniref:DUF2141 domain-containing protein n=1 Tax=Pseudoalteromonas luteoviolacea DSM 6061 TaxID=1365250 RepID=A0A166VM84_9GAMM|nr:DUF2141 domain-containing protein [Pseudoalteromonas luteoviolacea]KZN33171.1 hypothetical protein N475_03530 [Pseudoalteromonas luteoviolacea DSM 6061]MBE0385879.1 hypothetical protein [Pseudoalteromonas luteoviolacea DSM 6061]
MKNKIRYSTFAGVMLTMANTVHAHSIEVKINGIDTERSGQIMVMLFAQEGFPIKHDKAIQTRYLTPDTPSHQVTFTRPKTNFAVKVLHDEDNSGKTSKNWTGIIPSEGLGFSNGVTISWRGAPKFSDAKIHPDSVSEPIEITIRYP